MSEEYLNVNGKLEEDYRSVTILNLLLKEHQVLGIGDDRDHISSEGQGYNTGKYKRVNEESVSIICHSVETSEGKNKRWESYIVIDELTEFIRLINQMQKQMEAFFNILSRCRYQNHAGGKF